MKYSSTRGDSVQVTAAEAIIKGLAADSGLFVPDELPRISPSFIEELVPLSYEERAVKVLRLFLADANDSLVIVLFHMEPSAYCAIISIGLFPSISLDACGLLSVCAD